jgi:molybdopterin molybdotransferase
VTLNADAPEGQGVRLVGSDFAKGDVILSAGEEVNAGTLALLAAQGVFEIDVFAKPKVAVIVTGNEVSATPSEFQIYDSNTPMLRAQVESTGCDCDCKSIGDDFNALRALLAECAGTFDAVVVSGGASVGDYDFLARAVDEIGVTVFHGVSIKPGKPFLFAKVQGKPLFGLPGNPASAFVTFELFVRPALRLLGGNARSPQTVFVTLDGDVTTKRREEWLRCRFVGDGVVEPVAAQGSFGLRSLAAAEALVRVPAETRHKSGEKRQALLM